MRIGRILIAAIGIYIISFIITIVASVIVGIGPDTYANVESIPVLLWIIALLTTAIVSHFGARWYFSKNGVHAGVQQGLWFGIILSVIGFVLDAAALVLLPETSSFMEALQGYFAEPMLWVAVLIVLAATTFAGKRSS